MISKKAIIKPPPKLTPLQKGSLGLLVLGIVCFSSWAVWGKKTTQVKTDNHKAVPVVVAQASRATIPLEIPSTGTVEAYSTVSIKSLVDGQLMGVYFQQGQQVKKGQLLFKIDPAPFQADLDRAIAQQVQAQAQVQQAIANLQQANDQVTQAKSTQVKDAAQARNADIEAKRYTHLFQQGAVTQEQAQQYRTSADAAEATVAADRSAIREAIASVGSAKANVQNAQANLKAAEAAVASARTQLAYTTIYAPIDGQTGSLQVNQGNLVKANDTSGLVVINQIHPTYISFSIPQQQLPELKKYMAQGKLEVDALIPNSSAPPIRGKLTFVDNTFDATTGTIQLKATFNNTQGQLSPGEFVDVVLKLAQLPNAIVVPSQALQTGQNGQYVYVVQPDRTVAARPVQVGDTVGNETVINRGLQPGEQVVTDGQFNLAPGVSVAIQSSNKSQ
ncbi:MULTISPECIES: efflux RND transporter periplasmic adaptor subunit [Nostoc]|uniref:Efflux RND transporter periplasmic adaptor subunit n=1 Tax=Nostoc paludosum FACHB-159 TaxID=2692908 RepID=A0ABR8KE16_9NOSO|nr:MULTISPECIES: efflux RND transporter periplasmic adaptor subunit [Nostoc]MBD2681315.1 efflux RND transporter periplasmic adaptor subunit [Nostoc sp. FACHB-857]MBD2737794.1 efflux RND transporter periplasmic adaptor subunit [Nostoc paludosum FACHB-159]